MRRSLLKNLSVYTRNVLHSSSNAGPKIPNPSLPNFTRSALRLYSSGENPTSPSPESTLLAQLKKKDDSVEVEDVSNKELKELMDKYFKGDEEVLPSIMEKILHRRLSGKHEETDDELMEEFRMKPLDDVKDKEFESDFEELYQTDEEIDDLYNAKEHVTKKMVKDEYFNMDDKKWDEMIKGQCNMDF
ncbi:hypothetical protein GH714_033302 [Hevea brasiliensis]|uniref:Uncharacterized protein n=1 Tax=Hevea brasiliensis TaxID=3981 RepID=A0A6A6NKF6_HEVBR|nr:hypothetical protein GH714_033302 [Hevea brasiliensis]